MEEKSAKIIDMAEILQENQETEMKEKEAIYGEFNRAECEDEGFDWI